MIIRFLSYFDILDRRCKEGRCLLCGVKAKSTYPLVGAIREKTSSKLRSFLETSSYKDFYYCTTCGNVEFRNYDKQINKYLNRK